MATVNVVPLFEHILKQASIKHPEVNIPEFDPNVFKAMSDCINNETPYRREEPTTLSKAEFKRKFKILRKAKYLVPTEDQIDNICLEELEKQFQDCYQKIIEEQNRIHQESSTMIK